MAISDPGIIDIDCDSDEDCKYVEKDIIDISLPRESASLQPVTTPISNSVILKPACIKLVDCYKFPWYFDQLTKHIIENKLVNNNIVNMNISEQIMEVNSNEFSNKMDKSVNKVIDINRIHEMFHTKMKVIDTSTRRENIKKRNDMELLNALKQRNKTGVDVKKNTGLIGLKIQQITSEKQFKEVKDKPRLQMETNKERIAFDVLKQYFVQDVDKVLLNMGTTITPVFEESQRTTKESELGKCAPEDEKLLLDLSVKPSISITCNLPATLDNYKNEVDLKRISSQTYINEKDSRSITMNNDMRIAEEICMTVQSEDKNQIMKKCKPRDDKRKLCKAMPHSKQTKKEQKKRYKKYLYDLKQQGDGEGCDMSKMITTTIAVSKPGTKEKFDSEKQPKAVERCEAKKLKSTNLPFSNPLKENTTDIVNTTKAKYPENSKQETYNQTNKIISDKSGYHTHKFYACPNKSFGTLNKFTNVLNKLAKQQKQSEKNETNKLYKKHAKNSTSSVQPKCAHEHKPMPFSPITEASVTREVSMENNRAHTHSLNETNKGILNQTTDIADSISTNNSITQLQYSNKNHHENSPNAKKLNPNNHIQFVHHLATKTYPLKTAVMETNKTDDIKSNTVTSSIPVESTKSNSTSFYDPVIRSITITKQPSVENKNRSNGPMEQSLTMVSGKGVTTFEDFVTNEKNNSPANTLPQAVKDQFLIQNIITRRVNKSNNVTVQDQLPNTLVSALVIRPTQTKNCQAQSLAVHNSMQSHILYRPQAGNPPPGTQVITNNPRAVPVPIYQKIYQHPDKSMEYPPWFTNGISPHMDMTLRPPLTTPPRGNRGISPHMGMNARPILTGVNGGIPPQMAMNIRPSGVNGGIPPRMDMNVRPPGLNARIPPRVAMNVRPPGVNGGIPQQITMNARLMPPGICNVRPNEVFWSSSFPPPKPPPPPPPLRTSSQNIPGFPFLPQAINNSIIGRNKEGIINKINITANVIDTEIENEEDIVKIKNFLDSTSLCNEVSTATPENYTPSKTKSELLQNMNIDHLENTLPISINVSSNKLKQLQVMPNACLIDLRSPDVLSQQKVQPTKNNNNDFKKTMPVVSNVKNFKVPQLFEDNPRPDNNCKRKMPDDHNLSHATHSKVPPIKYKKVSVSNSKREQLCAALFDDNARPIKRINNANPVNKRELGDKLNTSIVNLKRILSDKPITKPVVSKIPRNEVMNAQSPTKYKPGPLSRKMKFNNPRGSLDLTKAIQQIKPSKGYSPPILPIPTYEKIISAIPTPCNKRLDRPIVKSKKPSEKIEAHKVKKISSNVNLYKSAKKRVHVSEFEQNWKKYNTPKKISLDEYQMNVRVASEKTDEEAKSNKHKDTYFKINTVDLPRRASNADSDLGYDSDSTVKL